MLVSDLKIPYARLVIIKNARFPEAKKKKKPAEGNNSKSKKRDLRLMFSTFRYTQTF